MSHPRRGSPDHPVALNMCHGGGGHFSPRRLEPAVWRAALRVRPGRYRYGAGVVRVRQVYRGFVRIAEELYYLGGHFWVVPQRIDLVGFARAARRVGRG